MGKVLKTAFKVVGIAAVVAGAATLTGGLLAGAPLFGSFGALSAFGLSVGGAFISSGALLAGGLIATRIGFAKTPSLEETGATSRSSPSADPSAMGAYVFGQTTAPINLVFEQVHGADKELVSNVFAHAWHRIDGYVALRIEGQQVSFVGDDATGDWAGVLKWTRRVGTRPQTAISLAGTAWPATATGDGIAHSAMIWTFKGNDKLRSGIPTQISVEVRGALLYDPRLDSTVGGSGAHRYDSPTTWTYNAGNAALVALRYIVGEHDDSGNLLWGRGDPSDDVDLESFIAAANVADTMRDGIPRFRLAGMALTDNNHEGFFSRWEAETGGKLARIGGKWHIWLPHDDLIPTDAITDDDLLSSEMQSVSEGGGALYNTARGRFIDPAEQYQAVPYPDVVEPTAVADDGRVRVLAQDFSWVQDRTIAERTARYLVRRSRFDRVWTIALGWRGALYKPFDILELTLSSTGGQPQLARIIDIDAQPNGVHVITLQEEDASIYDDSLPLGSPIPVGVVPDRIDRLGTLTPRYIDGTLIDDLKPSEPGSNKTAPQTSNILHVSTAGVVSSRTLAFSVGSETTFGKPDGTTGVFPDERTYVPIEQLGILPGSTITATAIVTSDFSNPGNNRLRLGWMSSSGSNIGVSDSATIPFPASDVLASVTGTVPTNATHVRLSVRIDGGTGTVSIRQAMMNVGNVAAPYIPPTRGADNTASAIGSSVLKNGSFENGFAGWNKSSSTTISGAASHSGTQSVLAKEAEQSTTRGLFPDKNVNYIPAKQGDRFLVSVWMMRNESDLPSADAHLSHRESDSAKTTITPVSIVGFASKDVAGWQRIAGAITIANAGTEFLVMVPVWSAEGIPAGQGGSWYIDDVSIEKLPRTLDDVPDGSGRAGVDPGALTSGKVDLSKTGVINKILDNIGDSTTFRKTTINEADGGSRAFSALASGSLIADAVGFQDNLNSRRITRALAVGSGINGQSFIFSPARQSIPKIRQRPGGEFGVPNPSGQLAGLQWYKNIGSANATTAGFDLVARFEAVTTGTPVQITDSGAVGTTGSAGSLVIVKSQSDEDINDTYTLQFDVTVGRASEDPLSGFLIPGSLEIAIDTRPAGGAWTQRATKFFQNNSASSTFPKPDQKVDIVVDGLALNAEFRVRVTSEFSGDGAGSLDAFDSVKYDTPGSQTIVTEPMTGSGRTLTFDVLDGEEDTLA